MIYYSAYRCGLGTDYESYVEMIHSATKLSSISLINEPVFSVVAYWVNHTVFSPVLVFALFSALTIIGVFSFYNLSDNKWWLSSIAVFAFFPALYFNTFNLVRQFAAAGLFCYSLRYIKDENFKKYIITILLASMIHVSALILIPCYFILRKKISNKTLVCVFVLAFLGAKFIGDIIMHMAVFADRYGVYADSDQKMGSSIMIVMYNILAILLMYNQKKIHKSYDIIATNCFYIMVVLTNLSFINFHFFRLSIFFFPSFAYILPKVLSFYFSKSRTNLIVVCFTIIIFIDFLTGNLSNPKIVPDHFLPLSSIVREDVYYRFIHII